LHAYPILTTPRGGSAFWYPDPEGAPDADGRTYHAGLDWFAPGGSEVRSAASGSVVEARASRGNAGQIFGGTAKVRERGTGIVYVMRHVDPLVGVGQEVRAGEEIARVTWWADGADHVHLEVWRTLSGGYYVPNMIDPASITWSASPAPGAGAWPPPYGGSLRLVLPGHEVMRGWGACIGPMLNIARNGLTAQGCRIYWRGGTWIGPRAVAGVVRHLIAKYDLAGERAAA